MRNVMAVVGVLVLILGLGWVLTANDLFMAKTFSPKYEQVRRDTFVQSQAYNEGMAQQVEDFHMEYIQATPDQKRMLAVNILHRTAGYDTSKLPPDDRMFLDSLRIMLDNPASSSTINSKGFNQ
jgi:hypothetical protein